MKTSKKLAVGTALAGILGLAAQANASYVTYDFTSGSINGITAVANGTTVLLSGGSLALNGGDVVFDPTAGSMQLQSFSFTGATLAPLVLTGPLTGDTLAVSGLTVGPGVSYAVSGFSGTNPYHFLATSIAASGHYVLAGSTPPAPHSGLFNETGSDNTSINATLTLASTGGGEVLGLNGVTLGTFNIGTVSNPEMVTLKGNITFDAMPVPLPAAVWLFASGLALLPAMRRRRTA
jgi:hypothetical protein